MSTPLGWSAALCRGSVKDAARRSRFLDTSLPAEKGSRFPLVERTTAAGSTTARKVGIKCALLI